MNETACRTNRPSNFARRFRRLTAALLAPMTVVILGLGAAPASAATSVYDHAFTEYADTAPCHVNNYFVASSVECGFNIVDVAWVTARQYVVRQDSASAYYPGRGWVTQPVSNPTWIADCNQNQCSVVVPVAVPPWVSPSTDTQWISSTGLYSAGGHGTASITPGFTWIHLHTDLCVWDGTRWSYHKSIDHYVRADLSFYS